MTKQGIGVSVVLLLLILAGGIYFIFHTTIGTLNVPDDADQKGETSAKPAPAVQGACYVGGCSGQICSDQKDMMSTCEFKEEYACYKTATCERQSGGQCGWTETPQLSACISSSRSGNGESGI